MFLIDPPPPWKPTKHNKSQSLKAQTLAAWNLFWELTQAPTWFVCVALILRSQENSLPWHPWNVFQKLGSHITNIQTASCQQAKHRLTAADRTSCLSFLSKMLSVIFTQVVPVLKLKCLKYSNIYFPLLFQWEQKASSPLHQSKTQIFISWRTVSRWVTNSGENIQASGVTSHLRMCERGILSYQDSSPWSLGPPLSPRAPFQLTAPHFLGKVTFLMS